MSKKKDHHRQKSMKKNKKSAPPKPLHPTGREGKLLDERGSALSLAIAKALKTTPHLCYMNALHTLMTLRGFPQLHYVEGWLLLQNAHQVVLVEHGWCEYGEQRVLDPTLALEPKTCDAIAGYFEGVVYTREEMVRLACQFLPAVRTTGHFGADGLKHPGYRAAYQAAYGYACHLATTLSPSPPVTIQPSHTDHPWEHSLCAVEHLLTQETLFSSRAELPPLLSAISRALQPHLEDWELAQQWLAEHFDLGSEFDLDVYHQPLVDHWMTQRWSVPLKGLTLVGKVRRIVMDLPQNSIVFILELETPWQQILVIGGPLTCFCPQNYQPIFTQSRHDACEREEGTR
jgi:hypothetical protein